MSFILRTKESKNPLLRLKCELQDVVAGVSVALYRFNIWYKVAYTVCPGDVTCVVSHFTPVCIASPCSQDLTFKALLLSMQHVTQYGKLYREAIVEFKIRHFEDRSKVKLVSPFFISECWTSLLFVLKVMHITSSSEFNFFKLSC
jgi:hypothetical protein